MEPSIFSMTSAENSRSLDMHSLRGLSRLRCPPAVVITHDQDNYSSSGINPSGEPLVNPKMQSALCSSTLSLAADGRNGVYGTGGGPPSRSGSPRHSKVHPSDGSCLPKSCSSTVLSSDGGSLSGGNNQSDLSDLQAHRRARRRCYSDRAKRTTVGFFLTILICFTWIGITHLLKWAYLIHLHPYPFGNYSNRSWPAAIPTTVIVSGLESVPGIGSDQQDNSSTADEELPKVPFKAPFFTTWMCTAWNCLFFPAYVCTRFCTRRKRVTAKKAFLGAIRQFQEKGLSALHFFTRSMFFCVLWVATNYMLIHSLTILDATAVMALHASSASFVYLLSWVILHEQFVGIRIVAVILCNTGIALLAYMDGVSRTSTLGGVVLAAAAAAGLAVHKVLFKKFIGNVTMGQLSLFLTLVGLLNVLLLWPIGLTLYLVKAEILIWTQLPYAQLGGVAALFILANVLGNFDIIRSYNVFVSIGIVSAVPVSAVLDVYLYNVVFQGMKLAGVLVISIGFLLVLLPDNWPDYITQIIRWRWRRGKGTQTSKPVETVQPKCRLRASSGNIK